MGAIKKFIDKDQIKQVVQKIENKFEAIESGLTKVEVKESGSATAPKGKFITVKDESGTHEWKLGGDVDTASISELENFIKAFSITSNITGGNLTGDVEIEKEGTANLTIVANIGFGLPTDVTVTNATKVSYNAATGELKIKNPINDVVISGNCIRNYLTITALESGTCVSGYFSDDGDWFTSNIDLVYSRDDGATWETFWNNESGADADAVDVFLNKDEHILLKNNSTELNGVWWEEEDPCDEYGGMRLLLDGFNFMAESGRIAISGKISSLFTGESANMNTAMGLFRGCTSLVDCSNLILDIEPKSKHCYSRMFEGCENLTKAPQIINSNNLGSECYKFMFTDCAELKVTDDEELGGTKFFTCSAKAEYVDVEEMFAGTGGSFTGTPEPGKDYYYN